MSYADPIFLDRIYPLNIQKPTFRTKKKHLQTLLDSGEYQEFKNFLYRSFRSNYPSHSDKFSYGMFTKGICTECDSLYPVLDLSQMKREELQYIVDRNLQAQPIRVFHQEMRTLWNNVLQVQEETHRAKTANKVLRASKGIPEYRSDTYGLYLSLSEELKLVQKYMTAEEDHFYVQLATNEIPELIVALDKITEKEMYSIQAQKLETLLQSIVQEFKILLNKINKRNAEEMKDSMSSLSAIVEMRVQDRSHDTSSEAFAESFTPVENITTYPTQQKLAPQQNTTPYSESSQQIENNPEPSRNVNIPIQGD